MQMTELIPKLGRNDVKLIGRDSFLILMGGYMIVTAVILRFGLPALDRTLVNNGIMPGETFPMRFAELYPMLVAYFAFFLGSVLTGVLFGFMLLDEKDDQTIKAMLVTPVPLNQYVLYRIGVPTVLAFVGVLIELYIMDLALLPAWQLVLLSLGAALTAPIAALFFATFAENKVQGFAMSKFAGIAGWTILIGWFVPEPVQWLIGIFPPFWIAKAYWMAFDGVTWWWAALVVGVVLQIGLVGVLVRKFRKAAYR